MSQLRIRDNATIKKLEYPEDLLESLQKIVSANIEYHSKRSALREKMGGQSPCSICGGIPTLEVRYPVKDWKQKITRIERYCDQCAQGVYERESVL